jgi:hypothetical protein
MSKGLRTILPVAAMFIPVIGPAIGAKIGLTGALAGLGAKVGMGAAMAAKVGAAASGALVGGALNKAAGGSFAQGAIGGAVGGFAGLGGGAAGGAAGGATAGAKVAGDVASAGNATNLGNGIMGAMRSVGGQISQGLQDPNMWGRAAQYLAAGGIAKATAQKDPALARYMAELERVSKDNREIQRAAFGVGNELVAQARGINPIAEGQIAANQAGLQVTAAGQEAVRNIDPSRQALRAVGTQQYYTDAAREKASAFNVGFRGARADQRAGLQGAYSGTPLLDAQGAGAAQLSMQGTRDESTRAGGINDSLTYIFSGQQPAGQQTQGQQPQGNGFLNTVGSAIGNMFGLKSGT